MKRYLALILSLLLLFSVMPLSLAASAEEGDSPATSDQTPAEPTPEPGVVSPEPTDEPAPAPGEEPSPAPEEPTPTPAAQDEPTPAPAEPITPLEAAESLHTMGLFKGTGTDADGKPVYDLDRALTRHEAITMLVRLLGKEEEAKAGTWTIPFTDVAGWAKPYVGYAYEAKLTSGSGSATSFGGTQAIDATQYLTFVLRALGYDSSKDFQWNKAWELTNELGITNGEYDETADFTRAFTRGDMAVVSFKALTARMKDSDQVLANVIGVIVRPQPTPDATPAPTDSPSTEPTPAPTDDPATEPTPEPTDDPAAEPTPEPTVEPTPEPTATPEPTVVPNKIQDLADFIATSEYCDGEDGYRELRHTFSEGYASIAYDEDEKKVIFQAITDSESVNTLITFEFDLASGTTPDHITAYLDYLDSSKDSVLLGAEIDASTLSLDTKAEFTAVSGSEVSEAETEHVNQTMKTAFGLFQELLKHYLEFDLTDIGFTSYIIPEE